MKAEELDRIFDEGEEDVVQHFDMDNAIRPNQIKRVNVDFPSWMIATLDVQARKLGISRQAVIKTWIGERIKSGA
jgi:hypothetical protein